MTCAALCASWTGGGVAVRFVAEQLAFTAEDSPMATLLLSVLGAFAEFKRALIRERQLEGIALAKARGAYKGRKPSLTPARPRPCGPAPRPVSPRRAWPASSASAARPSTPTCPLSCRRHRRPPGHVHLPRFVPLSYQGARRRPVSERDGWWSLGDPAEYNEMCRWPVILDDGVRAPPALTRALEIA